jgi:uncharacterized protein (DUF1800 family)
VTDRDATTFALDEEARAAREALRAWMASRPRNSRALAERGTPAFVDVAHVAPPAAPGIDAATTAALATDPEHILAGHLLRRAGFGPTAKEVAKIVKIGPTRWVEQQLDPRRIDDSRCSALMGRSPSATQEEDHNWITRWYVRMTFSRRQLLEKTTLVWHEHFATSNEKVGVGFFMHDQEEFLRAHALGSFRDLLIGITKDQAMLIWLDNNYNSGSETEPPNENYAREFLQLFTMGTAQLNLDGTPVLDAGGRPVPAYTEADVRAVSRALTGWYTPYPFKPRNGTFSEWLHDDSSKTILGATLVGRSGPDGAQEVEDVVDLILAQRRTTVAAFISKMLIQKLATETPTPQYVQDVATVFDQTNGSLKDVVRAVLLHPEFSSPSTVRSQWREPIEQFVGAVRALDGKSRGDAFIEWSYDAGQLVYYPPSVFSFYPPGNRGALLSTAYVFIRDSMANDLVRGEEDTKIDAAKLIKKLKLKTVDQAVDILSDRLLAAPLQDETRAEAVAYMNGEVTEDKVRGLVWLLICSPDFQRN